MKHYLREIRCEGLDTSRECFAIQELLTLHYANFPPTYQVPAPFIHKPVENL